MGSAFPASPPKQSPDLRGTAGAEMTKRWSL